MENNNKKDYTNIFVHTKFYVPSISMDKDSEIVRWFSYHPLFNINGMCKIIKIDTANFSRNLAKGRISKNHIEKIEEFIGYYGYEKRLINDKEEIPVAVKEVDYVINLKEKEGSRNEELLNQIKKLESEAPPPERSTTLGKKVWVMEQAKKIAELKNKL